MKRVRAIIIGKDGIYESRNVRVFRDFITVDGTPYPKPKPRYRARSWGLEVVYIINESILTREQKEQLEYLERLVKKKELEAIVNAIMAISARTRMQAIMYVLTGLFAGAYVAEYGRQILDWLRSLPPETAAKGFEALSILGVAAVIGAIVYMFLRKR
ncbi:MAG: hypothetical protein LM590_09185 [Thermofilum sp.]|nr:hypothetical protein [Thermofilum sp.]